MVVYINTDIPIEQLSEQQKKIENNRKMKVREDYVMLHKNERAANSKEWSKNNKDALTIYRELNREKIREQYKAYKLKHITEKA